jgi:hypothetical protein
MNNLNKDYVTKEYVDKIKDILWRISDEPVKIGGIMYYKLEHSVVEQEDE